MLKAVKAVMIGTTALAVAGATVAYAQQRPDREGDGRRGPNVEDTRAYQDARLAALKAGLRLTTEQESHWTAFEQAVRDLQRLRNDRMTARITERNDQRGQNTDPIERLRRRAARMAETGAALQKLADATDPLFKSLDDTQKRRFAALNPMLGGGREGSYRRFGMRDDGPRGFDRGRGPEREGFNRRRGEGDRFDRGDRDRGRDEFGRGREGDRFDRGGRDRGRDEYSRGRGDGDRFDRGDRGRDEYNRGREGDRFDRGDRGREGFNRGRGQDERFDRGDRGRERYRFDRDQRGSEGDRFDRDRRNRTYGGRPDDEEDL